MSDTQKKPDAVVYNEDTEQYDASLKPYMTSVSAPAIKVTDTTAWKNSNVDKVNKQVAAKYKELKSEYDALMEKFEYNNLIYSAQFSFEPIVGYTYHLYRDGSEHPFLSIIAPNECNFDHVGSFRLNADKMWEKIN